MKYLVSLPLKLNLVTEKNLHSQHCSWCLDHFLDYQNASSPLCCPCQQWTAYQAGTNHIWLLSVDINYTLAASWPFATIEWKRSSDASTENTLGYLKYSYLFTDLIVYHSISYHYEGEVKRRTESGEAYTYTWEQCISQLCTEHNIFKSSHKIKHLLWLGTNFNLVTCNILFFQVQSLAHLACSKDVWQRQIA